MANLRRSRSEYICAYSSIGRPGSNLDERNDLSLSNVLCGFLKPGPAVLIHVRNRLVRGRTQGYDQSRGSELESCRGTESRNISPRPSLARSALRRKVLH